MCILLQHTLQYARALFRARFDQMLFVCIGKTSTYVQKPTTFNRWIYNSAMFCLKHIKQRHFLCAPLNSGSSGHLWSCKLNFMVSELVLAHTILTPATIHSYRAQLCLLNAFLDLECLPHMSQAWETPVI